MHQTMMRAAQGDEVGGARFTPMRPVVHVMRIHVARVRAPREAAALIPRIQCPAKRGRNAAGPSTDVQRFAAFVLDKRNDAGVASEPPDRLGGQSRPLLDLTAT